MATSGPTNLPAFLDSNAVFQTWCIGIHDKLIACGLVQTADTGQLTLASATLPGATNTAAGYEIFRFNDALQATIPVFIKIEYGTGSVVNRPSLWIQTGSGTNGTGTLTFTNSRSQATPGGSKTTGVLLGCYASGDGSRFSLGFSIDNAASMSTLIAVERTRDATGVNTGDGWVTIAGFDAATLGGSSVSRPGVANVTSLANSPGPCVPVNSGALNVPRVGSNDAVGTMEYFIGAPFHGIGLVIIDGVATPGITNTLTCTVCGTSHTYLVLTPNNGGGPGRACYLPNSGYMCMLWE